MTTINKVKISDFLKRYKHQINIDDSVTYKRVTIRTKNQGISLRDEVQGNKIGTKIQFTIKAGQFLMSKIDARYGAFGVVNQKLDGAIITGNFWAYDVDQSMVDIEWLNQFTNSLDFYDLCEKASSGVTHRKYLKEDVFLGFKIDLPTLKKQHELVDITKATLTRLKQFHESINLQLNNIELLRNQILQESVSGKLTEKWRQHNPNTTSATELLKEINNTKRMLFHKKENNTNHVDESVKETVVPYELPESWAWVRFQDITQVITCGIASTPTYYPKGKIFLSARNVKPYRFIPENHKFIDEATYKKIIQNAKPELNDILLTRVGAGIGEAAIIDKEVDFAYYVSLTLIKLVPLLIEPKYILHFLNSPSGIKNAVAHTTGKKSSQGNLNVNKVRSFLIPLPPLEEQKIIVKKVDSLVKSLYSIENKTINNREMVNSLNHSIIKEINLK